ncbi:MAG: CHASE2 domain-containing protein [Bacteroidales bacterium]|nr:CHASE2 domain-containing protein [Bacteroidales bacterium]
MLTKKGKWLTDLAKAVCTTVLVLLLMWVGRWVVVRSDLFSPMAAAFEGFQFSDLYFAWNRAHEDGAETDVVLVDIANCRSREEVALVVDSVSAHGPRVLGVDVIFPPLASADPSADQSLRLALGRVPRLVVACNAVPMLDGSVLMERSFFVDSLFRADSTRVEGAANMRLGVVRDYETFSPEAGMPTFAAEVVRSAGGKLPSADDVRLIDFGGCSVLTWCVGEEFDMNALSGRIVLMGDMQDLRDWHSVPATVGGESRMPGLSIHAAIVGALMRQEGFARMPQALSVWLQVCLLLAFCFFLFALPQTLDNWVSGALQLLFMLAMLPACYALFVALHVVCNPTLAIVGFGLAGLAKNVVDVLWPRLFGRGERQREEQAAVQE